MFKMALKYKARFQYFTNLTLIFSRRTYNTAKTTFKIKKKLHLALSSSRKHF